ncbi:MAG: T9SS type A sorting domain-containing protein [Bacteroidia bacterium]|nr:T9SS type A sorting domain-containing protein [Bacteroidia bacterium]
MYTSDGGNNWNIQEDNINGEFYSIYFSNSDTGYAVGMGGEILKTTNGSIITGNKNIKKNRNEMLLFPNPNKEILSITGSELKDYNKLQILNISGKILCEKDITLNTTSIQISTAKLSKGLYYIRFINNNYNKTEKIIIY